MKLETTIWLTLSPYKNQYILAIIAIRNIFMILMSPNFMMWGLRVRQSYATSN